MKVGLSGGAPDEGAAAYPAQIKLCLGGLWRAGAGGFQTVRNPASGAVLGEVAQAAPEDVDQALLLAAAGFEKWRATPAPERAGLIRKAASILRDRSEAIARLITLEQGKPLAESRAEMLRAAETAEWSADEAQRAYGRIIPSRLSAVQQQVVYDPVGPVAAFTPWNFPVNQMMRKLAAAMAAGCAVVVKGPEETPASCAELVRSFYDAGLPEGVLSLVFGMPAQISEQLIPSPVIRKVSFTGSTAVGKHLAIMAGAAMKPITLELGGHAPVLVLEDADVVAAAELISANKWRNAGQTCISPTRILVHRSVYSRFLEAFRASAAAVKVGDGLCPDTSMGPLANPRRLAAMQDLAADAVRAGARIVTGATRLEATGQFFAPTVLSGVPTAARAMNEEPFGPLALVNCVGSLDEAVAEANRIPYGLAAYAFTHDVRAQRRLARTVATGMLSVNHFGLGAPETPFGGVLDSGYGFEGGVEGNAAYLQPRFVTIAE